MDTNTIGQILKNAREKKGITIKELEKSTRIVARFIKALEDEEFDLLPGEIYTKGFIRNLCDKLSLDSELILERYNLQKNGAKFEEELLKNNDRNIKVVKKDSKPKDSPSKKSDTTNKEIQMASVRDIGVEEFKAKPKIHNINNAESDLLSMARRDLNSRNKRSFPVIQVIIILAVLVIIAVLFVNRNNILNLFSNRDENRANEAELSRNIVNSLSRQNVKAGDVIYFKPLGISATVRFNSIGNVVNINVNGQDLSLSKSSPIILDLNGNGINDFSISVIEVYDDLATVEMEKLEESQTINDIQSAETYSNSYESTVFTSLQVINGETYIEQNAEKASIRVEITARHFVYVRYFIDSDGPATTNLLSGRTISLEARDVLMLTIGNAGEVFVKVNGVAVNLGEAGETVNKTIKWVRNLDDSTRYNLIMSDTK